MGYPPPQERQIYPGQASLPTGDPPGLGGDKPPGAVLGARILLWIQGAIGALTILFVVVALIVLVLMWESVTGPRGDALGFGAAIAGVGLLMMVILVVGIGLVFGTIAVGVTIPTFILAARFSSRRNSIRVGALVLEAIVGVLCTFGGASSALGENITVGAALLLIAAMCWTAFGLLLSPRARTYFAA